MSLLQRNMIFGLAGKSAYAWTCTGVDAAFFRPKLQFSKRANSCSTWMFTFGSACG